MAASFVLEDEHLALAIIRNVPVWSVRLCKKRHLQLPANIQVASLFYL